MLIGVRVLTIVLEKLADAAHPVRDYIESEPTVLVWNGIVDARALRTERTTLREIYACFRLKGAVDLSQVDAAVLEVTGDISVILNHRKPRGRNRWMTWSTTAPKSPDECDRSTSSPRETDGGRTKKDRHGRPSFQRLLADQLR